MTEFEPTTEVAPRPHKVLPEGYTEGRVIDFHKLGLVLIANVLSVPLMLLSGGLFLALAFWARPTAFSHMAVPATSDAGFWVYIIVALPLSILLHELVHGFFFWRFTGERPVFGGNLLAAYAGAPDWYLPRSYHAVVGLAPLVILSVVGMGLLLVVPPALILPIVLGMSANAGGAFGDVWVAFMELREPPTTLVQDTGLRIAFYRRSPGSSDEIQATPRQS